MLLYLLFYFATLGNVNFCVKHDLKAIELSGNVSSYFRGDIYR